MASPSDDHALDNGNEEPDMIVRDVIEEEAMEVTEWDGLRRTTEHLNSVMSLRTSDGILQLAKSSVYSLETTLKEMTTAQAYILTMFNAFVDRDMDTLIILLNVGSKVEQLRSPYLEVWLREDFNFDNDMVRRALVSLDRMDVDLPGYIIRIFSGLTERYGASKMLADILQGGNNNAFNKNTSQITLDLDVPIHLLSVSKRVLGLGPDASDQDVKSHASKEDIEGYTLMHRFAEAGHSVGVEELLSIAVPYDMRGPGGILPIHLAAEYGQLQVLPLLLRAGSDISVARDDGNTPVHLAASMGNAETVGWLADHGANITVSNCKGQTPLHIAAAAGHAEAVTLLLNLMEEQRRMGGTRLGAIPRDLGNVDTRDSEGNTPLHLAARANHHDAVQVLLDRGADYNVYNSEGLSPLNEALLWGATEVEQLLTDLRDFDVLKYAASSTGQDGASTSGLHAPSTSGL